MRKEEKIENEINDEDLANTALFGTLIPILTNMLTSNNSTYEFEYKQLKELYHSLDKRIAILESKQTNNKKRFLFF